MKRLIALGWLIFFSGCASAHSPYDLYDWCLRMGSSRLTDVGASAYNQANCEQELKEDLADQTPRILYIPRDIAMAPVLTARVMWGILGRTQPPF
jgi:hypothetical protein